MVSILPSYAEENISEQPNTKEKIMDFIDKKNPQINS